MEVASLDAPQLSWWQSAQFILMASVGFLVDGYINLVIGLITPMLGYLYYSDQGNVLPPTVNDAVAGITNLGLLVGQLVFGLMADRFGRSSVYGKELLITTTGTIMVTLTPWPGQIPAGWAMAWISLFRFVTGLGIGGDYPVSGALTIERRLVNWRGALIAVVFGVGASVGRLLCGLIFLGLVYAFKDRIQADPAQLDYVWRLLLVLGLLPAVLAIYGRLKTRESLGYRAYVALSKAQQSRSWSDQWLELRQYYRQPRHLRTLIALALGWALYDVAYYAINLNLGTVLTIIGYGDGDTPWDRIHNQAVGNLVTAVAAGFCGDVLSVPLIDPLGRVRSQIIAVFSAAGIYAFWAANYNSLGQSSVVMLYFLSSLCLGYLSQTTYILPVEVFPTRVRSTSHGICAAAGKVGAALAGFVFASAEKIVGFRGLLWVFSTCLAVHGLLSFWVPESSRLTLQELESDIFDLPATYGWPLWTRGLIAMRDESRKDTLGQDTNPETQRLLSGFHA